MEGVDLLKKYNIVSRGASTGYRNTPDTWLVVVDKRTDQILRDPENPRAYLRFYSSDSVIAYLKKLNKKENK